MGFPTGLLTKSLKGLGHAAEFMGRHKVATIGTAAAAGALASHPLRGLGLRNLYQEVGHGDPNAIANMIQANVAVPFSPDMVEPFDESSYQDRNQRFPVQQPPMSWQQGPASQGPSGDTVLGLYNLRNGRR